MRTIFRTIILFLVQLQVNIIVNFTYHSGSETHEQILPVAPGGAAHCLQTINVTITQKLAVKSIHCPIKRRYRCSKPALYCSFKKLSLHFLMNLWPSSNSNYFNNNALYNCISFISITKLTSTLKHFYSRQCMNYKHMVKIL
jgi:hypothetical protein